jgi:murein DD-endopeptidase MepM/ murein hydrolase activator NlpD
MGNTDADQVKLHFEIRRQGKPVDPLKHLAAALTMSGAFDTEHEPELLR